MSYSRLSRHKSNGGMGFRDFRDFNLAMLGNQVWRFLTKPNSLVSKVYKARYFLNENYLDSSAGHNPSFVWRSIWKAGDVVKAGVHWVVGSGEMINILGQPWLLDDHNPFITSDSPALANNKVSSIMSMEHRGWDDEILKDLFNDRDQDCIRSVPLNEDMRQYRIYWSKESSGEYSVRSAYRLLQVQKALWRQEDNDSFWRKIWKIRALPKVLNLVWRSLSQCLPTMMLLRQKHVRVESSCPVCRRENETISHVFMRCPIALQCWQLVTPGFQLSAEDEIFH